jgi:hypothetical protein
VAVHRHHRGADAGGQAFLLALEVDAAVRGGLAETDAELLLHVLDEVVGTAQHTGDVGAHRHGIAADRFGLEHRIEAGDFVDRHPGHAQVLGDRVHRLHAHVAGLVLHRMQCRQHRRRLLVGRKLGQPMVDLGTDFGTQRCFLLHVHQNLVYHEGHKGHEGTIISKQ